VASVFRFGQVLFGTIAGALAAVLVATRSPLWGFSELGFMDAWAAAFVVWAALLELRSPRRGPPVFVLLGLAGLLRPEVWLFAAAYWLWIASGSLSRAVRLLPLAALGPLAWIAWDLATAQTFLGSVGTAEGLPVATSSGGHGISRAPSALVRDIGGFMRPPEVIAAVAGFALVCWVNWRRAAMPVVLIVLNVLAFAIVAERGGPIEQRYLLVAAGMLLVFAGYALAQAVPTAVREPQPAANPHGPLQAPTGPAPHGALHPPAAPAPHGATDPRLGRITRLAGALLAVACIAYAPIDIRRIADLRDQVQVSDDVYSDLRTVVEAPGTRCTLAGHVHVDDVRLRPSIAYWGAIPLERIDTEPGGSGTLVALDPVARELSSRSLPADPHAQPKRPPLWRLDGSCARQ
jgi:hypothetical protein